MAKPWSGEVDGLRPKNPTFDMMEWDLKYMQMGLKVERQFRQPDSESRCWYAVFTVPQNEKSVARHLQMRDVESFLPTYEEIRTWKNRQRVKVVLPLFPTYVFARICASERSKVLGSPGVLRIVGNSRQ